MILLSDMIENMCRHGKSPNIHFVTALIAGPALAIRRIKGTATGRKNCKDINVVPTHEHRTTRGLLPTHGVAIAHPTTEFIYERKETVRPVQFRIRANLIGWTTNVLQQTDESRQARNVLLLLQTANVWQMELHSASTNKKSAIAIEF